MSSYVHKIMNFPAWGNPNYEEKQEQLAEMKGKKYIYKESLSSPGVEVIVEAVVGEKLRIRGTSDKEYVRVIDPIYLSEIKKGGRRRAVSRKRKMRRRSRSVSKKNTRSRK